MIEDRKIGHEKVNQVSMALEKEKDILIEFVKQMCIDIKSEAATKRGEPLNNLRRLIVSGIIHSASKNGLYEQRLLDRVSQSLSEE